MNDFVSSHGPLCPPTAVPVMTGSTLSAGSQAR